MPIHRSYISYSALSFTSTYIATTLIHITYYFIMLYHKIYSNDLGYLALHILYFITKNTCWLLRHLIYYLHIFISWNNKSIYQCLYSVCVSHTAISSVLLVQGTCPATADFLESFQSPRWICHLYE